MWIDTLQKVLNELFEIYGLTCTIRTITGNMAIMSNNETWIFDNEGELTRKPALDGCF